MTQRFFLTLVTLCALGFAASAQTPAIDPGRILNAASYASGQGVAPGSVVAIFGKNFADATLESKKLPLETTLGDVTVTFNGIKAPLFGVYHGDSIDQINAQVPWDVLPVNPPTSNGSAQVIVMRGNVPSATEVVRIVSTAAGIFAITLDQGRVVGSGVGQAIAYGNLDGQIAAPAGAIIGLTTHPAKINDPLTLQILATGLGPVDHPVPNGVAPDYSNGIPHTLTTPIVRVAGVPADVKFSGLSPYVGVYQLNIVIAPGTPAGMAVPLQIEMDGVASTAKVTIAVE